jgi:hypothetical protein
VEKTLSYLAGRVGAGVLGILEAKAQQEPCYTAPSSVFVHTAPAPISPEAMTDSLK